MVSFPKLPALGWWYVVAIGALAAAGIVAPWPVLVISPYILAAPIGLLMPAVSILFVGLGLLLGYDVDQFAWPVALLWVVGWMGAAWLNASLIRLAGRGALDLCRRRHLPTPAR